MLIIDRFEEDWAVIEFGQRTFNIPKFLIPPEVRKMKCELEFENYRYLRFTGA